MALAATHALPAVAPAASHILKLSAANLKNLPKNVPIPTYNRSSVRQGIVHLGVGGFHRSHQAVYTARVLTQERDWGICGVGLVPSDKKMQETLESQDHLYTLVTKNSKSTEVEVIGSIVDYLFAGDGMHTQNVIDKLSHDDTKIVSLTVTEKAYMVDDATGNLDESHPLIIHDLENPRNPKTPVGYVVAGLRRRMELGLPSFTVMSCDNLPMNGALTKKAVMQFASKVDTERKVGLADWIAENTAFPSTMVDRITPATTPEDVALLKEMYNIDDAWPVCAEDYTQWVIEDNFPLGRPTWEAFGALLVDNVEPYELMKLRLLNGSHSALAYLSYLAGHRRVHEAMQDDEVFHFIKNYMDVITPTVPEVPGVDLNAYKAILCERFSNPNVSDQVSRLAEDGSKKMQGFIRGATEELLLKGHDTKHVAGAVAGWISYCRAVDLENNEIEVVDPRADELKEAAHLSDVEGSRRFLGKFLSKEIASSDQFSRQVDGYLKQLKDHGASDVIRSLS